MSEFNLAEMRWIGLDIEKVVTATAGFQMWAGSKFMASRCLERAVDGRRWTFLARWLDNPLIRYEPLQDHEVGFRQCLGGVNRSMKTVLIAVLAAAAVPALGQTPMADEALYFEPSIPARVEAMPRDLVRARGPGLMYALQLARAAVDACKSRGELVSVRVADSVGTTVVLLSGDGAGERSQLITGIKVAVVAKYRMPAAEVSKKARTDPRLAKEIRENPSIESIRGGSQMLMSGPTFIGVIAVSGAPGTDDICATEALAKYPVPAGPPAPAQDTKGGS